MSAFIRLVESLKILIAVPAPDTAMTLMKKKSRVAGFTITEVMLSAFLLTMGILAVMSLFVVAHQNSRDSRNVIIASNLSQEGLEIARNIRDNRIAYRAANWTTGDNCSTSTTGNCDPFADFPTGAAAVRTANYNSTAFITPGNKWLAYNGSGFHAHGAITSSGFFRVLKIDHTGPATDPVRVQSFVSWKDGLSNAWNPTVATCNPYDKCVYTELLLSPWK